MKRFVLISLLLIGGCTAAEKQAAVPFNSPGNVVIAPNAWVRGVSQEEIDYVKSALGQVRGKYEVKHPIISLGKGSVAGAESMRAYTILYYYDFERPIGGRWALVRCGGYNADSFR